MGEVTGVAVSNSILQGTLGRLLPIRLLKVEDKDEVCPDDANPLPILLTYLLRFVFPIFILDSSFSNGFLFGRVGEKGISLN